MGILLNTTGCDEHVPEMVCYIRNVKERVPEIVNALPLKKYPH